MVTSLCLFRIKVSFFGQENLIWPACIIPLVVDLKVERPTGPVKVGVIGSCFSRSMFRSEEYFNLGYKNHFTAPLTFS